MTPAGVAVVPPAAAVSAATSSSASSQVGDSGHSATTNGVNNGHSSSSIPWDLSPGAVVRLTLVTNTVVEGTVFTCDQRSRMLAVYAAVPNSDAKNVSVVPLDAIKAVHYIQKTTDRGPKYDLAVNETEMKRREVMVLAMLAVPLLIPFPLSLIFSYWMYLLIFVSTPDAILFQ